jgi:hypothetical protein
LLDPEDGTGCSLAGSRSRTAAQIRRPRQQLGTVLLRATVRRLLAGLGALREASRPYGEQQKERRRCGRGRRELREEVTSTLPYVAAVRGGVEAKGGEPERPWREGEPERPWREGKMWMRQEEVCCRRRGREDRELGL